MAKKKYNSSIIDNYAAPEPEPVGMKAPEYDPNERKTARSVFALKPSVYENIRQLSFLNQVTPSELISDIIEMYATVSNPVYVLTLEVEPKSERIQILLRPSTKQKLKDRAAEVRRSPNDLLNIMMESYVKDHEDDLQEYLDFMAKYRARKNG